jgi:hypothetical protein
MGESGERGGEYGFVSVSAVTTSSSPKNVSAFMVLAPCVHAHRVTHAAVLVTVPERSLGPQKQAEPREKPLFYWQKQLCI